MKHLAAHRIAGDVCFFFALLTLMPRFEKAASLFFCFLGAVLLCGYAAVLFRPLLPRLLFALPPALLLLRAGSLLPLLALSAAFLYFFLSMVRGRFDTEYWVYRDLSLKMMISAAAAIVLLILGGAEKWIPCAFGLLYLFNTVLTLRCMRAGNIRDPLWHCGNLLDILLPLVLTAAASALLFAGLKKYGVIFTVLLLPFAGVARGLAWILEKIPLNDVELPEHLTSVPASHDFAEAGTLDAAARIAREKARLPWKALLIVLLLALVFYLIFRLLKLGRPAGERRVTLEATVRTGRGKRKRKAAGARGNALKVRQLYCEYLDYLQAGGTAIAPADTSEDILRQSSLKVENGADSALRDIYIRARYGNGAEITARDVADARAFLAKYKGGR